MRLPDRILHTACLLGFKKETPQYAGSGFVAAVLGAHGNSHLYLVTAKHLAERMKCCPTIIGFNHDDGSKALFEVNNLHWYAHPTEASAVDAAVTPFEPAQWDIDPSTRPVGLLDVEPVPEHLFTSGERMGQTSIGVGDEITAIGVFTRFSYEDRHVPIARIGNLAMIPTIPIPVKNFDPMEAYVAEIEGLSGSPVWVPSTNVAQQVALGDGASVSFNDDTDMLFLGLLHGRWEVPRDAMKGLSAQYTENVTSGMSIIVPAHKILEVINGPELAALRLKNDKTLTEVFETRT